MSAKREFRISDNRSEINVFLDKARKPVITLNFNPADPFIAEYINNIRSGFEEKDAELKEGIIDELEYSASISRVVAENFDAICGEGAARKLGRYDSSGTFKLFFDIMDEIKAGLEAHYAQASKKAKEDAEKAVIEARKEGSSYIAPQ